MAKKKLKTQVSIHMPFALADRLDQEIHRRSLAAGPGARVLRSDLVSEILESALPPLTRSGPDDANAVRVRKPYRLYAGALRS
jgi:hypothetical protein